MAISAQRDLFDLQLKNNYESVISKQVEKFQNGEKVALRMEGNQQRSLEVRTSNQMLVVTYYSGRDTGFIRRYEKGSFKPVEELSLNDLFKKASSFAMPNHSKGATSTTSLLYKAKN